MVMMRLTKNCEHRRRSSNATTHMNTQPNYNPFCTKDPPGSREGSGDLVPPSRACLPAASSDGETSRSRGDRGPSPDYQMQDPSCSDFVALVTAVPSEEQQMCAVPNISVSSEHSPTSVLATTEAENLEDPPRTYVASGTKRKLDWLTDDVAVGTSSRAVDPMATETVAAEFDFLLGEIPRDEAQAQASPEAQTSWEAENTFLLWKSCNSSKLQFGSGCNSQVHGFPTRQLVGATSSS
ncbi:hypothetical protein C8R46DRAFT_1027645 [Mycena filopes]|nr:hypothetical protein C8R46DRAFT_1027645 [Mycena filopes]